MRGSCRVCGAIIAPLGIVGLSDQEKLLQLGQAALQHLHQAHPQEFGQLCAALAQLQTIVGLYVVVSNDTALLGVRDRMRLDAVAYFSRPDILAPVDLSSPTEPRPAA